MLSSWLLTLSSPLQVSFSHAKHTHLLSPVVLWEVKINTSGANGKEVSSPQQQNSQKKKQNACSSVLGDAPIKIVDNICIYPPNSGVTTWARERVQQKLNKYLGARCLLFFCSTGVFKGDWQTTQGSICKQNFPHCCCVSLLPGMLTLLNYFWYCILNYVCTLCWSVMYCVFCLILFNWCLILPGKINVTSWFILKYSEIIILMY